METILNTSEEAAKFVENISGWVSRKGMFFGNNKNSEMFARYDGCTHMACEDCGEPTRKMYTVCESCRDKRASLFYAKRERAEWDEKAPVYSEVADRYFYSWDEVNDYIEDNQPEKVDELRLIICDPVFLRPIDEDYWCDSLPEDGEMPDEVSVAINNLNNLLKSVGPISYLPGKKAVLL